jgi:hypothetical protein
VYFEEHDPLSKPFKSSFFERIDGVVCTTAGLASYLEE